MRYLFLSLIVCFFTVKINGQIITTIAGTGSPGNSGNGGQATNANLFIPAAVTFDASNNLYISDGGNSNIRKVSTSGIISTFAGNGSAGYSGDGGQATNAKLNQPNGMVFDALGNMYIADFGNNLIRKINTAGVITTFAGIGTSGPYGDGGQASSAELNSPWGLALDMLGNLFISDGGNARIRKVNTAGIITTVVGNGTQGYIGDGGAATAAELNQPKGITLDAIGNLYIADEYNNRIRKVNTSGIINTIVGNGTQGFSGDGGQATMAELSFPYGIVFDAANNFYIVDGGNQRIRKVSVTRIITTIVGNGTAGYSGDGGQATAAELNSPYCSAFDVNGNLFIADVLNARIRIVNSIGQTTSMEQLKEYKEQITIYPNPSNGSISILNSSSIDYVKVTDIIGQTIYEAKPNSENTILNIDNSGVYFVTITSGKETSTKKVIVDK
ncbi:MAG TPA: T9SS type A sorting domain-containing protein [Bacteroidia bacterium]|jgi:hypothetical protein|nr:T9SS type A sorting domain-containing protein [Bacteroidia bacterium]